MPLSEVSNQILPALLPELGNNRGPFRVLVTKDTDTVAATAPVGASAVLTPVIESALKAADTAVSDLDLIAVSLGPGSFTGLRVGIVTAKTLAYATQCPVVGIHVADALALQSLKSLPPSSDLDQLSIGLDIGRGEVLTYEYELQPTQFRGNHEGVILQPTAWISGLVDGQLVTGSGLRHLDEDNKSRLILPTQQAPTAVSVAILGLVEFARNGGCDFWKLEPIYSRPSTAEEVRMKLGN